MPAIAPAQAGAVWARWQLVALFVVVTGVYLATGAYSVQSIDVVAAEEPAFVFSQYGTLDVSGKAYYTSMPWYVEHEGGVYSDRFPGAIFYLVPAYWVAGHLGYDTMSFVPGVWTSSLVAAGSVVLMAIVLRRVLSRRAASVGTLVFAFGTGTWSVAAHAPWSHTLDQFLICAALALVSAGWPKTAGAVAGLMALVRPPQVVAVAVFGLLLGWYRRSPRLVVAMGVVALPSVVALFAYNGVLFGSWGPSNGYELGGQVRPRLLDWPLNILGTLASPTRGVVVYYPFLVVVPFTLRRAWRAAGDWERAAFWAGLAGILTQLLLNRYSGGDTFFGNRLVIEALTFATPVLARSVALAAGERRALVTVSLLLAVAFHAFGVLAFSY